MKVLFINSVCGIGSTGRICKDLAEEYKNNGNEVRIAYGRNSFVPTQCSQYSIRIGNDLDCKLHALNTRLFDRHGFCSKRATRKFLEWADEYNPDLLWLHNIHGYYINVEMLFEWIKKRPNMQVKWTLHDCWSFTGHCTHFIKVNCNQWKYGCSKCIQTRTYPACLFISSVSKNYNRKKAAFTGVKNIELITPSKWLADLTRDSFLKDYSVKVEYNTIDKTVFKPTYSDFRIKYNLDNKYIILGVANVWNESKGLYDFFELSKSIGEDKVIVLVGLNKKQMKSLPDGIVGINRTSSPKELAEIYTAADVFVNPTYEDNYPTVNLEAQACGTKVITYDTGGCRETIKNKDCIIIKTGDKKGLLKAVMK